MIEWLATDKVEVVKTAFPPLRLCVDTTVELSLNVTVPVGVPPLDVTVAVKLTDWPNVDGFTEETRAVEVEACFTVCVRAGEVLPEKLPPPA